MIASLLACVACGDGEGGTAGDAGPADGGAGGGGETGSQIATAELAIEVTAASIDADGVVTARFRVTDQNGNPLDLAGRRTEGAIEASFVLARLDERAPGDPLQYTAYTTRTQTSPETGESAVQASADDGGTFSEIGSGEGTYEYRFATRVTDLQPDLTHTIGVWAEREVGGETYVANATFDFVPAGGPVVTRREVVSNEACNSCHDPLEAHGGVRRDVHLCTLCHSPQTVDPDTGNTVDLKVMAHKIHMGEALPSVQQGDPYQIIGYMQRTFDFSTVVFPHEVNRCETCHRDAAQAELWKTRPTIAACTSCHDRTAFVSPPPPGFELHAGGEQSDEDCTNCHEPDTGFRPISRVHEPFWVSPEFAVELAFVGGGVTGAAPGESPTIEFSVTVNGEPRDILADPLTSLRVTVAGPTTDYRTYWQASIEGPGLRAGDGAGEFRFTLPPEAAIPAGATGTYAFALEGSIQPEGSEDRFAAYNPITYAAVTGAEVVPRREVVSLDGCNRCHGNLRAHGGSRRNPDYCAMCHNPMNTNDERVARTEGSTVTAEPVDLKVMIHKIHRGEDLTQPYVLGGYPPPSPAAPAGTPVHFDEVRYPGNLADCSTCHVDETFALPLAASVLPTRRERLICRERPTADTDDFCDARVSRESFIRPTTAVCTSCHDSPATVAHAQIMTSPGGDESCATCHGPGAAFDAAALHADAQGP